MIIGITGSIGAGKTTVTAMFKKHGCNVIDADKIGRTILQKEIYQDVIDTFGKRVLDKKKRIDRKKLRKVVFYNKNKLTRLNHISHPIIINKIKKQLKKNKINVIDAAVLIEANWHPAVNKVIVVKTKKEIQVKRLLKSGRFTRQLIEKIIKSQMPITKKLRYANYVIDNSKTLRQTEKQVKDILTKVKTSMNK